MEIVRMKLESSNNGNGTGNLAEQGSSSNVGDSKTNLIVNYLPQSMSQEEIQSLFGSIGPLQGCKLVRDKATGESLCYAFVNFCGTGDAEKAISLLNGLRLQNKTIKVSFARPSSDNIKGANLYISNLPNTMAQQDLEDLFSSCGKIVASRILHDNMTGLSKGVGFVRFDQRSEAQKAIDQLNGVVPEGGSGPLSVKFATSTTQSKQQKSMGGLGGAPSVSALGLPRAAAGFMPQLGGIPQRFPSPGPMHRPPQRFRYSPMTGDRPVTSRGVSPNTMASTPPMAPLSQLGMSQDGYTLFVYNLTPEAGENILWQLFGPFGAVQKVNIMRDKETNKCKGYGFVTMTNYNEALVAIQNLNGYMLGSKVLQVSFKTQKAK